jgi:hypothetical protein
VTKDRTARWHRYWDKQSRTYDKKMTFFDRHLLGDSRTWACGQATGTVRRRRQRAQPEAYPHDITLTGIDLSDAMLDIAATAPPNSDAPPPFSRPTPTRPLTTPLRHRRLHLRALRHTRPRPSAR